MLGLQKTKMSGLDGHTCRQTDRDTSYSFFYIREYFIGETLYKIFVAKTSLRLTEMAKSVKFLYLEDVWVTGYLGKFVLDKINICKVLHYYLY